MPRRVDKRTRIVWALAGLAAVGAMGVAGAAPAASDAPANVCWSPEALAGRPAEHTPVKGIHTFDKPEPQRAVAPFSPVDASLRGAIRRVHLPPGQKLVALTFDLCEQPGEVAGYDGAIIDYLRRTATKATFFAGGKWMRSHDERAQQLIGDPLFEVGNHSEAHRNLRLLAGTALGEEIAGPQRAYETLRDKLAARQCHPAPGRGLADVPQRIGLFRFPYGACNAAALAAVNDAGLVAIQWDLSTGDPSPAQSAAAIASAMVSGVKPGSIVIAHANGRGFHTAEALPVAIPALKAKGFRFVTVSELLNAGTPEIAATCYDSHPGDTDKYDHPPLHAKAPQPPDAAKPVPR